MICRNCGKNNSNTSNFCQNCGKKLNKSDNNIYFLIIGIFILAGIICVGLIITSSNNESGDISNIANAEPVSYEKGFPVSRAPELAETIFNTGDFETITFDSVTLNKYQCIYILSESITRINNGESGYVPIKEVGAPPAPQGRINSGTIAETNYLSMCTRTSNWIDNNGVMPNFIGIYSPRVNDIGPNTFLRILASILIQYKSTGQLPPSVSF
ncbi:MAG: zinc ribbon domain-containing protein [Methanobacteriaceae archaeon]|jgi:hypothetical protein|nr:zinc ribbon domain-containing protein [Methanobacteriaceae archaeon]